MGILAKIGSFVAGFCVLAGASLNWHAIDIETPALGKYEKMAYRYDAAAVFFVGVTTVFYAFMCDKLPHLTKIFLLCNVGIVFYTCVYSERMNGFYVNDARIQYENDSSVASWVKDYLAGGLLAYAGFIIMAFCVTGNGLGSSYKAIKVILLLILTALTITGLFLVGTSATSNAASTDTVSTNLLLMSLTLVIWLFAAFSVLTGNHELAAGSAVLFGYAGIYCLSELLIINDALDSFQNDAQQTRAGYVFCWCACITALITVLPVYSTTDSDNKVSPFPN